MVHENLPAGVIVTGGLGGGYQDLIIAQFHLFLGRGSPPPIAIEIEVRNVVPGRGLPHGLEGTRYDPRYWPRRDDDDDEPWAPPQDEKEVVVKIRFGQKEIERHYFRRDADRAIKAINILNNTKNRITVTADKIKDTTKKPFVFLKNLRKKDDDEGKND